LGAVCRRNPGGLSAWSLPDGRATERDGSRSGIAGDRPVRTAPSDVRTVILEVLREPGPRASWWSPFRRSYPLPRSDPSGFDAVILDGMEPYAVAFEVFKEISAIPELGELVKIMIFRARRTGKAPRRFTATEATSRSGRRCRGLHRVRLAPTCAPLFAWRSDSEQGRCFYQTNLMVYAPGGYRFTDFTRIGLPLNASVWVISTAIIPVFWPFR
jgi:hypothetical protein